MSIFQQDSYLVLATSQELSNSETAKQYISFMQNKQRQRCLLLVLNNEEADRGRLSIIQVLTTYVNVFLSHVIFGLDGDALETKTRVKSAAHELNKNIMFYLHIPTLPTAGGVTKTLFPEIFMPQNFFSNTSDHSAIVISPIYIDHGRWKFSWRALPSVRAATFA